jgi:hypothetical protein
VFLAMEAVAIMTVAGALNSHVMTRLRTR